jgi:CHAT domain-containing protein/tetratricopeptide (TPR) repeat protein
VFGRLTIIASRCILVAAVTGCTGPPRAAAPLQDLVAALGSRRTVEPRLTGGFAYASCAPLPPPSVSREGLIGPSSLTPATTAVAGIATARCSELPASGTPAWNALAKATASIQHWRGREPHAAALAASAVAALTANRSSGAERAVRDLEAAAAERPSDPRILSDLAAACFVRAQRRQDPADLIRALAYVERAVEIAPRLPEALFNRALILARLHLRTQAVAGWKRFQSVEPGTGWSAEAVRSIADLTRLETLDFTASERRALRDAAQLDRRDEVLRIVALSPQAARELAMNALLPEWGDRFLRGDGKAAEPLAEASAIGAALEALHGDQTIAATVQAIHEAVSSPARAGQARVLATAHGAYAEGNRRVTALAIEGALPVLRRAHTAMVAAKSPMAAWAAVALGGAAIAADHHDEAVARFSSVLREADALTFPALCGRANWGLGLVRARQGRYAESLDRYQHAATAFRRAGEILNLSSVESLLAEDRKLLGQADLAWRHRLAALGVLSACRASRQLHNALWEGSDSLLHDGAPEVALAFAAEDVAVAAGLAEPLSLAVALLQRSHVHAALGRAGPALADLGAARTSNAAIESRITRERMTPDLDLAEAELLGARDPQRALALLAGAVDGLAAGRRHIELARAVLTRARALLAAGEIDAAERQLREALDRFLHQRATIVDAQLRQAYSEAGQDLFDEMILLQARLRHDPLRSFEWSETARILPPARSPRPALRGAAPAALLSAAVPSSESNVKSYLARIPADVTIVEYSLMAHRLLTWVLRPGEIAMAEREVDAGTIERATVALLGALHDAREERPTRASALLYSLLIPRSIERLPAGARVVFVPDKLLNAVPFAALENPLTGRFLIEDRCVSVAPSAALYLTILAMDRARADRRDWSALLVANPRFDQRLFPDLVSLPQAAAETEAARRFYHGAAFLAGTEAVRGRLLAELDRHEVFAFAGHAVENPRDPADSYLVLASSDPPNQPGILRGREIAALRLERLRMVILSACHTTAAASSRTAGIAGLSRAFLDAGADAVLGTLWDADDEAASQLLPEFHRRFTAGLDAASALRAAQLALLHADDPSLRSPARWAAFELVGDIR